MTSSPSFEPYVPYARRRNTPAQLDALHKLFQTTPHPTRSQRQALADEFCMEVKSVTNWFQNKRQTARKKSLSCNENIPERTRFPTSPMRHQHRHSKTPLDRSKISLDHIAALSERSSLTLDINSQRSPLTPRKSNIQQRRPSNSPELWTHMPSSPVLPSSPDAEEARLSVLSSRAKTLFLLDWACLKARQRKWVEEDIDGSGQCEEDGGESDTINHRSSKDTPSDLTQFGDVEAAITLLDFKMHS